MDPDNQPSTSKKAAQKTMKTIYPVSFEVFKKFTNVEEFVQKEMERAGPEIYRINHKIKHRYYPIAYQQFYEDESKRKKMMRHGLTIKAVPKFLKDKFMLMAKDEGKDEVFDNTRKDDEKRSDKENHRTEKPPVHRISKHNHVTPQQNTKSPQINVKNSANKPPNNKNQSKKTLALESEKITNYFCALELSKKSYEAKDKTVERKRKQNISAESRTEEPQTKQNKYSNSHPFDKVSKNQNTPENIRKLNEQDQKIGQKKNDVHQELCKFSTDLLSEDSESARNVQIIVDKSVTIDTELSQVAKSPKRSTPKAQLTSVKKEKTKLDHKRNRKKSDQKRKPCKRKRKCSSDDLMSDDSDVASNVEVIDLSGEDTIQKSNRNLDKCKDKEVTSPLPRRIKIEDFKKPRSSIQDQERHQSSCMEGDMALLSVSEVDIRKVRYSSTAIHEWIEKGLAALQDHSDVEPIVVEYCNDTYVAVDKLTAIYKYPKEVKQYIRYLLNLEIQKGKHNPVIVPLNKSLVSRSKVVTAFLQMTFEEYRHCTNAEKLLSQKATDRESCDSNTLTYLMKQYESIMRKENPWPKGVYFKLPLLKKFLQSKELQGHLKPDHLPPRILSFEDVLEYTNLKEFTSLKQAQPPELYKTLLQLCKKEYVKCCQKGFWTEGIEFTNKLNLEEVAVDTEVQNDESMSMSMSMLPLRVNSSDLRSTQQCVIPGDEHLSICSRDEHLIKDARTNTSVTQRGNNSDEMAITNTSVTPKGNNSGERATTNTSSSIVQKVATDGNKKENALECITNETQDTSLKPTANMAISQIESFLRSNEDNSQSKASERNMDHAELRNDQVYLTNSELMRTLLEDLEGSKTQQSQGHLSEQLFTDQENTLDKVVNGEILRMSQEGSVEVINSGSSESARQLLSNIVEPSQPVPLASSTKLSITVTAPAQDLSLENQNTKEHIPSSPNLFPSSGESIPKCNQSEQIKIRSPETVFVSCKHSMTCQEEENNLTTLITEQQNGLVDPFANTSINQENIDVMTPVIQDPSLVVKQEMIPICNDDVETSYNGPDDSVQIIDLPPSEPITIEDEETTPELLDMLLNYPSRTSQIATDVANLPHMSSLSFLDNFPEAQRLPSNLSLTQSQSKSKQSQDEPTQATEEPQNAKKSKSPAASVEFIQIAENSSVVGLESLENNPEIEGLEASTSGNLSENDELITNKTTDQTIESMPNGCKISQRILNKEFSSAPTNKSTNISYVSIAPQSIPSEIELTQASSSNLINSKKNYYQGRNTSSGEDQIIDEDLSNLATTLIESLNTTPISVSSTSLQEPKDSQRGASIEENEESSDESTVSIYVYLSQEISVSKNPELIKAFQDPIKNQHDGSVPTKDNKTHSKTNTSKDCTIEQNLSSLFQQAKDVVSTAFAQVSANSDHITSENATSLAESVKNTHNLYSQGKKSEGNISRSENDRIKCLQNIPPEELIDKRNADRDVFQKTNSPEIVIKESTLIESNRIVNADPLKEGDSTLTSNFRLLKNNSHEESSSGENETSAGEDEPAKISQQANDLIEVSNVDQKSLQTDEGNKDIDLPFNQPSRIVLVDKLETKNARKQAVDSVLGQDELLVNKSKELELLDDGHEASPSILLNKNSQVEWAQNGKVDEILIINASAHDIRISLEISSQQDNSDDSCSSEISEVETDNQIKCLDVTTNFLSHNSEPSVSTYTAELSKRKATQFSTKASKNNFSHKTVESELPPVTAHTLDELSCKIPALLPIPCTQSGKTYNQLETSSLTRRIDDQNEDEQLVEVPFLIKRKFLKSLPFNVVIPERIEQVTEDSTIYAVDINLEYKAEKRCIEIIESEEITKGCEAQLSPIISLCQSGKKTIKDSLGEEAIVSHCPVHEACIMNIQTHEQKTQRTHVSIPLKELRLLSCVPATILGEQNSSGSGKLPEKENSVPIRHKNLPSKAKLPPKQKKKKASPKKLSKKQQESDFVPQITHAYRSLPLASGKKPFTSKTQAEEESPMEEDKDVPIKSASQAVASSTASQILGTDCTYFESSQLLQNIDHCSIPDQLVTPLPDIQASSESKVNIFSHIILSEGIMARKIWKVHLEWKRRNTMSIEIKFITNKRWLTVCDKSAKLMFNFSPNVWSDVLRVLREINRFDYKGLPCKKFRAATPLHNVLRVLFNNAERVVNVRLIESSLSPYASCEKINPVYKKPFQCLTKGIPKNILSRMKALKENLQNQQC